MDVSQLVARLRAAEALAADAGRMALARLADRGTLGVQRKGAQDVVTDADVAIERMIVSALRAGFPDDAFLGEEGVSSYDAAARACWVIDPIDGTANFARGLPHWCVAIALVVGGRTELGVICEPVAGRLYSARRGAGATRDGQPLRVSTVVELERAQVDVGYSSRTSAAAYGALVTDLLQRGVTVTNCGSAALGLARVADGAIDGYAERHLYAWDALAGLLLIEEAGGRVNAFLGGDALFTGNETIAATPALYATLCDAMDTHR